MAELTERLGFNLADTFTGYVEQLAHFFEGMVGLFADAETLAEHLLLTRRQIRQHGRDLFGELGIDHLFGGRDGLLVLDEIPKGSNLPRRRWEFRGKWVPWRS